MLVAVVDTRTVGGMPVGAVPAFRMLMRRSMPTALGLRSVAFEVDDVPGIVARLAKDGYGLVGASASTNEPGAWPCVRPRGHHRLPRGADRQKPRLAADAGARSLRWCCAHRQGQVRFAQSAVRHRIGRARALYVINTAELSS